MVFQGVPHSIRSQIWLRITGALEKKLKSEMSYKVIVKTSSNDHLMTSKQIEKVLEYFFAMLLGCQLFAHQCRLSPVCFDIDTSSSPTRRAPIGDRTFPVASSCAGNSLPTLAREIQSLPAFHWKLKMTLFVVSFPPD